MQNNQNTNIEHIIAKIDNDFNIDNSDWIPRVAAWVIEALSILKCTKLEKKRIKLKVEDKIVNLCNIDIDRAKFYDEDNCRLESIDDIMNAGGIRCGCSLTTGKINNFNIVGRDEQIAIPIDSSKYPTEYVTTSKQKINKNYNKYYIKICDHQIELNYDAEYIFVEYNGVKTYYSETYKSELPVIPNNGLLIEAIGYYCIYKILCRGYKHPVMNLGASQYGTNPFFMWNNLKDEARRSVIIDEQGEVIDDGGLWRNSFFNFTFNPRD